jgi:hypothetical protein
MQADFIIYFNLFQIKIGLFGGLFQVTYLGYQFSNQVRSSANMLAYFQYFINFSNANNY